jgi:hypothetical protein
MVTVQELMAEFDLSKNKAEAVLQDADGDRRVSRGPNNMRMWNPDA